MAFAVVVVGRRVFAAAVGRTVAVLRVDHTAAAAEDTEDIAEADTAGRMEAAGDLARVN